MAWIMEYNISLYIFKCAFSLPSQFYKDKRQTNVIWPPQIGQLAASHLWSLLPVDGQGELALGRWDIDGVWDDRLDRWSDWLDGDCFNFFFFIASYFAKSSSTCYRLHNQIDEKHKILQCTIYYPQYLLWIRNSLNILL